MLSLLKRKCPHCGQRSIGIFRVSIIPSRCPSCNGLVKENPWYSGINGGLAGGIIGLVATSDLETNIRYIIMIILGIIFIVMFSLLVPVVAVSEEEGVVSKEKKD